MDKSEPQWSNLPTDVLAKIEKHIYTGIDDTLRFRAICRSFRSSVPLPPKALSPYTPLKVPYPIDPNPSLCDHLLLTQSIVYAIEPINEISNVDESAKTWVFKLEESDTGKFVFKDPRNRFCSKLVSKLLPKSLNLLDYQVKELAREYGCAYVDADGKVTRNALASFRLKAVDFNKVVVSKCLYEIDDEFALIAIHSRGRKLGVWRYGDKKWTTIDVGFLCDDIVFHKNNFYCFDSECNSTIIIVDPKSLKVSQITPPLLTGYHRNLVKSFNDLFLIDKHSLHEYNRSIFEMESSPISLSAFRLDEGKCDWVHVIDELDGKVLFEGYGCSFFVSAKEFFGFDNNCAYVNNDLIIRANELMERGRKHKIGSGFCIFDMNNNNNVGSLSAFQGYSKIIWPPPTWLKQDSSSHSSTSAPWKSLYT